MSVPALSLNEVLTAKGSIFFNKFAFGDGRTNLSPEGRIAMLRGGRFDRYGHPIANKDLLILEQASKDLATYLGFSNTTAYQEAVFYEGSSIFNRVNNGNS